MRGVTTTTRSRCWISRPHGAEVRFIEYMDVGGATHWSGDIVVSRTEMLERLRSRFGALTAIEEPGSTAPADRFALPDGRVFGVIASTTTPFCGIATKRESQQTGCSTRSHGGWDCPSSVA
jgi:molybdenum cofactor biosynthesis enzyme MoaA